MFSQCRHNDDSHNEARFVAAAIETARDFPSYELAGHGSLLGSSPTILCSRVFKIATERAYLRRQYDQK